MLLAQTTFALLLSIWSFPGLPGLALTERVGADTKRQPVPSFQTNSSTQTPRARQSLEEYAAEQEAERERKSFEKYAAEQEAERERTRQATRPRRFLVPGFAGDVAADERKRTQLQREAIIQALRVLILLLLPFVLTAKWWWPPLRRHPSRSVGVALLVLGSGFLVGGLVDSSSTAASIGAMMLASGYLLFGKGKTA